MLDALFNNLARTLCELATRRFDGVLFVEDSSGSLTLDIAQGLVCAAQIPQQLPYRSRVRQRLLGLFSASQVAVQISPKRRSCGGYNLVPPLHPLAIVRQFLQILRAGDLEDRCAAMAASTVKLRPGCDPPWWLLQSAEVALTDLLLVPHAVSELFARWPCQRAELLRLIALLAAAGALEVTAPQLRSPAEAYGLLGVEDDASPGQVRQAYLEQAKRFHPDRHPDASSAQRRALAHRFSAIDAAYRVLQRRLDA